VESLQLLRVTNAAAKECLIEYTRLKEKLVLLQEMNKGCSDLDCYIVTNTTWWIKLTNFLARFCSLFKTTSGTMIDEATLLKNELAACRLTCEQEIKSHLVVMQKNNDLGHELLAALPGQQDVVFKEVACPAESFDRNKTNNLLSKLSLFGLGKQDAAPNCSEEDDFLWFDEASGHPSSCGQ
jgi:hypothetical protein